MEVGAVKQAYNNEVILLKKKFNQAKIQIIHKLTRKAKTLTEKKVPENLKEKLTRKATAAVNEVLIIKKVTHKELAKFAISHTGDLKDYLNKPNVDKEKAYARLLLHKALQDKYEFLRTRFSNMPVEELVRSREERRKLKKEEKEKQKNKKKEKASNINKSVSSEGGWSVEDLPANDSVISKVTAKSSDGSDNDSDTNNDCHTEENQSEEDNVSNGSIGDNNVGEGEVNSSVKESDDEENDKTNDYDTNVVVENKEEIESSENVGSFVKLNNKKSITNQTANKNKKPPKVDNRKKIPKQHKDGNKNKNLAEKIQSKKFKVVKKNLDEKPVEEKKIVDSFFITSTGENYMSVAEPRAPDEVKEVHKHGNRQMRRAAKFGHELKFKPRRDNNFGPNNGRFREQNNKFDRSNSKFDRPNNKFDRQNDFNNDRGFKNNKSHGWAREDKEDSGNFRQKFNKASNMPPQKSAQPEKLHPSWEAKKKISSILPFQGKKITFD